MLKVPSAQRTLGFSCENTPDGLSHDGHGFLRVDGHCRVIGTERIFAAGDVTDFPVKRVGVAAQEARVAAAAIAAAAGCAADPAPLHPAEAPCGLALPDRVMMRR